MRVFSRSGQILDAAAGFGLTLPGSVTKPHPAIPGSPGPNGSQGSVFNGLNRRPTGSQLPLREIGAANRIARGTPQLFGAGARVSGNGPSLPFAGWL